MWDWETPESCLSPFKSSTCQIAWPLRPCNVNVATKEKTDNRSAILTCFCLYSLAKKKGLSQSGTKRKEPSTLLAFKCGKVPISGQYLRCSSVTVSEEPDRHDRNKSLLEESASMVVTPFASWSVFIVLWQELLRHQDRKCSLLRQSSSQPLWGNILIFIIILLT